MAVFTSIGTAVATSVLGAAAAGSMAFTMVAGVTAFALQTAAGMALSYFGSMLSGKDDKTATSGVRLSLTAGGDVPRSFMDGLGATAGSLVYANEWGNEGETPNAYNVQVIALSDLPSKALPRVWVNDAAGTFGTAHATYGRPVLEFRDDDGKDHLWIKFYDGSQTAADPYLVNNVSSAERPYSASRVGYGITYAIVTSLLDEELLSSIPKVRFVLDGCRWYDPSRDSSVGGVGTQRADDPSTWGGDGDYLPAVQMYNKMRGIEYNGQWFYGLQNAVPAQLPVADWIAQINKCRATIAGPDGPEPTYRSGGEVLVSSQISDALSDDLTACNGRMAEAGGIYKLRFGEPETAVAAFDDGHIISTEGQTFTPFFKLMESISGVTATHPNPETGYNPKVAPILRRPDVEERLGRRRQLANVSLVKVPYPGQVQRLIKWAMAEGLNERRHVLTMPPEYGIVEPGDIVQWSSERNGYVDKIFRVDGVAIQPNLDVLIEITETDPSDYDWDQVTDYRLPVDGPTIRVRPAPQEVSGPLVAPVAGELAYDVFWSAASVAVDVQFVRVSHRKVGDVVPRWSGLIPKPDLLLGEGRVYEGLYGGETVEVQLEYVPVSGRATVASAWMPVTIADVRITIENFEDDLQELLEETFPAAIQDLKDDVQDVRDTTTAERDARLLDTTVLAGEDRDLRSAITRAMAQVGEISLIHEERRQKSVTELRTDFSGSLATVRQEFETAVGPTGALALADLEIRALVADETTTREAAIDDVQQALVEGDQASVTAVQTLATQMRGAYGGNDADLVTEGLLASLRQIIDSGDSVLAQAIEGLSVGLGIEFDYRHIWDFADDAEGWTGSGVPTATDGRLRPADGAAPYVVSPVLELDGDRYRRFKALIYRTGAPAWAGYLWWKGPSDTTWDAARRVAIPEPAFAPDGSATLEVATTWSGTIAQVRVDATSAADAGHFIAYEWLALGRRFPPPSTAYVDAIRQALVTADSAEATARLTLKAALMGAADPETADLAEMTEGLFHEAQTAWVAADQVVSDAVAVLASRMTDAEGELDAVAQVQSTQQTAINAIDGALTILANDYDDIVIQLEGKASVETTNGLSTQIANLGAGGLDVLGSYVRTLGSTVQGLASNVNGLGLFLQDNRERTDKAVAEATRYTNTQITQTNDQLTVVAEDVNALLTQLIGVEGTVLAQANTLIAHDAQLVQLGDDIEAVSSSVINVEAAVGDISGNGLFAMRVAATPTGFSGAIELGLRDVAGGTPSWTGLILARKADGTSQAFLKATQTAIFDGTGAQQALFDAAGAYFNNARIRGLKVENMDADFIEAIEVDADTILAQNASVTGQLTVGSAILIDGPNGRIVVSD